MTKIWLCCFLIFRHCRHQMFVYCLWFKYIEILKIKLKFTLKFILYLKHFFQIVFDFAITYTDDTTHRTGHSCSSVRAWNQTWWIVVQLNHCCRPVHRYILHVECGAVASQTNVQVFVSDVCTVTCSNNSSGQSSFAHRKIISRFTETTNVRDL